MVRVITSVRVFDSSLEAAQRFSLDTVCTGLSVAVVDSVDSVLLGAHIAITSTWARQPFLFRRHLHTGLHITTLGPDQPGKCELGAEVLTAARLVVDDRKLAVEMGAVGGAGLSAAAIHAELGEVIAGFQPGRETPEQVTAFGSVGLAFQDLAAGWLAFNAAREMQLGRWVNLLS
jgi:ornithine cyclodeaminase/alanine dehydrogenase-like protein (mu-crystallin family)